MIANLEGSLLRREKLKREKLKDILIHFFFDVLIQH